MGKISVLQLCQGCFHFHLVAYIIKIIIFLYGQVITVRDGYTSMMMVMIRRRRRRRRRSRRSRRMMMTTMMLTKKLKMGKKENEE